jgi:DNA-binding NarL/FixJ family response regulator
VDRPVQYNPLPVQSRRVVLALVSALDDNELSQLKRHMPNASLVMLDAEGLEAAGIQPVAADWPVPAPAGNPLTSRQRDILELIVQRKSNKQIGRLLAISPFTVRNHVSVLLRTLNVATRDQAAAKASAWLAA